MISDLNPPGTPGITLVAGPSGIGKTTWISQFLANSEQPLFYLCPGAGTGVGTGASPEAIDRLRIGYCFPQVTVVDDSEAAALLMNLPDRAQVYIEVGAHLDLAALPFNSLPCRKVAIVPPGLAQLTAQSEWHNWANELVAGNNIQTPAPNDLPNFCRMSLTGQVFDPSSLEVFLAEVTGGAYGPAIRLKGIFELPNGQAFYIDFVEGLEGIEYTELKLPRSLRGRPIRLSGLEVVGYNLHQKEMAETLQASCLSDELLAQYQRQYRQHYRTTEPTDNTTTSSTQESVV
ncbi:MAG: GTP-binding protein [Cyanobacteria bacterium P01_F01_bin.86]